MEFELEKQYQFYLKKVGLKEKNMGETQKKETRQAFMAGVSQSCLYYFSLAEMDEDEAVNQLDNVMRQVSAFWASLGKDSNL